MATTELKQAAKQAIDDGQEVPLYSADAEALGNAGVFSTPGDNVVTAAAGVWIARGNIRQLVISAFNTQVGAASGCVVEQSETGASSNQYTEPIPDVDNVFTTQADHQIEAIVNLAGKYFRFAFTNGATPSAFSATVTARR